LNQFQKFNRKAALAAEDAIMLVIMWSTLRSG